jgi:hypothetical protein
VQSGIGVVRVSVFCRRESRHQDLAHAQAAEIGRRAFKTPPARAGSDSERPARCSRPSGKEVRFPLPFEEEDSMGFASRSNEEAALGGRED